ncbi:hypothetical protein [Cellulosimicrobium cellulans]|uniref:hypothetical protein n=1 Tax=Cellulosimicrobium cellulans TaxID=1710 RepID=UPI0020981A03|nr:hypothetical protein [Cellulosimicrobium cellulans]MCO7275458.1 hypothetical protein [Cellulosimicrobium cellulans]
MARPSEGAARSARLDPASLVTLVCGVLCLVVAVLAALAPTAVVRYRHANDASSACLLEQQAPPGFDGYTDRVVGRFTVLPARVDCAWHLPDGREVRTSRAVLPGITTAALVLGGVGIAGVGATGLRVARRAPHG